MNMSTNDSGHVFSLDGSLSLDTSRWALIYMFSKDSPVSFLLSMRHLAGGKKKDKQKKTRCHNRTERCICSTLNQPQGSTHPGSNKRRRVRPAVDINMGASEESSGCEQCAFGAGCLLTLMNKQVWKHAV